VTVFFFSCLVASSSLPISCCLVPLCRFFRQAFVQTHGPLHLSFLPFFFSQTTTRPSPCLSGYSVTASQLPQGPVIDVNSPFRALAICFSFVLPRGQLCADGFHSENHMCCPSLPACSAIPFLYKFYLNPLALAVAFPQDIIRPPPS